MDATVVIWIIATYVSARVALYVATGGTRSAALLQLRCAIGVLAGFVIFIVVSCWFPAFLPRTASPADIIHYFGLWLIIMVGLPLGVGTIIGSAMALHDLRNHASSRSR